MKKIIIGIVSIVTVLLTACGDDFFENPRPQESQWVNTTTFDQGLTYGYYYLVWSCYNGIIHMPDFASSGAAQLLPETDGGIHWNESYNRLFNQNTTQIDGLWTSLYRVITMCNQALEIDAAGNGNPFGIDVTGSDYKDNYVRQIGEYYFLRGAAYYTLMRVFAPPYVLGGANDGRYIPFATTVPTNKEAIYSSQLGSAAEIYAQVVTDLKQAESLLPEKYTSAMLPNYEVGRACKYTAAAMLAKVFFAMGEYSEAEKELNTVINAAENTGRFVLEEPIQAFNKLDRLQISNEAIWEFDTGNPALSGKNDYMYYGMIISLNFRDAKGGGVGLGNMVKSGWNQFTFSYWALKTMGWMTDPDNGDYSLTQEALNDLRYQQLHYYLLGYKAGITATDPDYLIYESVDQHRAVTTPQLYLNKYFRGGEGTNLPNRHTKFPLLRLGEMYLIRSWVRWKAGNNQSAADDLNKIWNRANPDNPNRYNSSNVNHDAIFTEHLKEMTGENWTLDFMMGTRMDIPPGDRKGVDPVKAPYSNWYWPIPVVEKELNPNYK